MGNDLGSVWKADIREEALVPPEEDSFDEGGLEDMIHGVILSGWSALASSEIAGLAPPLYSSDDSTQRVWEVP